MKPEYEYGDEVRLTRNVRNDGTYPGAEVGDLLIPRGSCGVVCDVGTYLQDQLIYRINFVKLGKTVGCRGEELISSDAPWTQNRFEFRDRICSLVNMKSQGELIVQPGDEGEVARVIHEEDGALWYHVRISEHTFQVPEAAICAPEEYEHDLPEEPVKAAGGES